MEIAISGAYNCKKKTQPTVFFTMTARFLKSLPLYTYRLSSLAN